MLYPIYDYYHESSLTLEEVLEHYVEKFYLRKHGRDKYEKILQKVAESDKVKKLFDLSYHQRLSINYIDFGETLNSIFWFMFQSNETQAVAVLAMARNWNVKVNSHLQLKSNMELRNDALKIFKKFSIYGDMTQEEYDRMRSPQIENEMDEDEIEEESEMGNNYHILNFYLDCSHWHKQEDEIKKCPLVLPVKIIDIEEEDDIALKYEVRNLPTLILVDGDGNEIHRWVGVTPSSEINDYITENGYGFIEDVGENDNDKSSNIDENDMDDSGIPDAVKSRMDDSDFHDKCIAILAEGGTKEQIQLKMDYLSGKKTKPAEIIRLEQKIRGLFRKRFDAVGQRILIESSSFDIMHKIKAATILSKCNDALDDTLFFPEIDDIKAGANKVGISVNIIKDEEYKRALAKYRDGKTVD